MSKADGRYEKKWTPEQLAEACRLYDSGLSVTAVAEKLGMGKGTVQRATTAACVKRPSWKKTHSCREDAFSTVTEESAYWAGFLMADGSVTAKAKTKARVIHLMLKYEDRPHLQKFMAWLELDSKITDSKRKEGGGGFGKYVPVEERAFDSSKMTVTCERLAADLERYGVIHRKTYCAEATPLIAMNKDFWRGCIDGDGTIVVRRTKGIRIGLSPSVYLVGTPMILEQFRAFIHSVVPSCNPVVTMPKGKVIGRCGASGRNAIELARILYGECTVALDRKWERAKELLSLDYAAAERARNKNVYAPEGMAWCGGCKDYLPREAFSVVKQKSNGLHSRCMQCNREYNAEYRRKPKKQLLFAT